ncbi:MAG: helix-turn-helix domain-containing protein [Clostridiales bacterium]|nr:helix-turn-helix domain-containing protein [Clostridiales bacterium]
MDIIQKLNAMRLERNLSVYRLAELSGLTQSTLANTFSRGTVPSVNNLQAICEAMGVTLAQFFAEEETAQVLTAQETTLIRNFRRLSPAMKKAFADMANACPKRE